MKKSNLLILFTFAAALLATGCSSILDKLATAATKPVTTVNTVTNTVVAEQIQTVTNFVPQVQIVQGEPVTNVESRVVIVTNEVPVTQIQTVTNTVYVTKDGLDKTLAITQAGAAFVPPPYGTIATVGLGLVSGFLGFLVKRKNGENQSLSGQLTAVVKGVEQVSAALPADNKLKETIADVSKVLGVSDDLHQTVQTLTAI